MTSFAITDNRRLAAMPIRDEVKAQETAARPLETLDIELATFQPPEDGTAETTFDLSPFALQHGEFLLRHSRAAQDGRWLKEFKALLGAMTPDATLISFHGANIATFRRDAQLNMKRLEQEQPHIIAKYTRTKTVTAFDQEAFRNDLPHVYAIYRGRSYRLIKNPQAASLFEPA